MYLATLSLFICLAALTALVWLVRRDRMSLGLPVAYMVALLLEHVPGAFGYVVTRGVSGQAALETGIWLTAVGASCFVVGVFVARRLVPVNAPKNRGKPMTRSAAVGEYKSADYAFWLYCLFGGWAVVYGLSALIHIPSVSAVIEKGGAIWMLGVMLGQRHASINGHVHHQLMWLVALIVYPSVMLMLGGFLSYGSAVVIIVMSILTVSAKRYWVVLLTIAAGSIAGISVFVNYFAIRNQLRAVVWSNSAMEDRINVILDMIANFKIFDPANAEHLRALDARLNQNYFIGVAAERLQLGQVEFLRGKSVWEGIIALVPRAFWPEKPVYGGSPQIVTNMTGLNLNQDTSWGVGNVMEFYINFATPGVVAGFLILGLLMGWLDRRAAQKLRENRLGAAIIYFLPAVALIQPIGSIVELSGGAAAALIAAFCWKQGWEILEPRRAPAGRARPSAPRLGRP